MSITELPKKPPGWGTRHTVVILGFVGFAVSYSMRFNLSLAIVAMVRARTKSMALGSSNQTEVDACPHLKAAKDLENVQNVSPKSEGEFEWNEAEQGFILGCFFWGYVLTQLPGGIISQKYGGKWPYGIGLAVTGIAALFTPIGTRFDKSVLILIRIIQGIGEGLTVPSFHVILSRWAPPQERSNMSAIAYGGAQFGTAVTLVIGGYIIQSGFLGGWPGVFYTIGIVTLVWFVLWCIFMFDTPENHPRISAEELEYIQTSLGDQTSKEIVNTPWLAILTSIPVWAIVIAHMGHNWGQYTLLTELPTYMRSVLHFDIKQNSLVSALPFTVMWICSFSSTRFADFLIQRKVFRVIVVRKICQATAHWGGALALIAASYSGCDRFLTIGLLTTAAGFMGAAYGGYNVNHIDIGRNHAGILMGITNTFANICGFGAPYVAGLIINENTSLERWQLVFFLASAIFVFNSVIFICFATSTEQPWNRKEDGSSTTEMQVKSSAEL